MKYLKFLYNNKEQYGKFVDDKIHILCGNFLETQEESGEIVDEKDVKILAPTKPSKIVCVGLNYVTHAKELGQELPVRPLIFLKPPTTVIGYKDKIKKPSICERLDYEGELGVVIGKRCKDIKPEEAKDYIFGFTCLNDVTARDITTLDGQWTRGKSFDTFCPIGPYVETELDYNNAHVKTILNGEVKQDDTTKNFVHNVDKVVSFISSAMTLEVGDVIATGTPHGISPMKHGDEIIIEIEGIGRLINTID